MRRLASALAPLLALTLLAGCDGSASPTASDTDSSGTPTSDLGQPCVVGEWDADATSVVKAMEAMGADVNGTAEGSFTFRFGADDFESRWNMIVRGIDAGAAAEGRMDATILGTWSGPDDDLTLALTSVTGETHQSRNGEEVLSRDLSEANTDDPWTATCSGSTLTVDLDGTMLTFKRR